MSITVEELTQRNEERIKAIDNEEVFGITYDEYPTNVVVDDIEIIIYVYVHDNGFAEFQSNLFWSEPAKIYPDGKLSWSSGTSTVAGNSSDAAMVMSQVLEISRTYL